MKAGERLRMGREARTFSQKGRRLIIIKVFENLIE